MSPRVRSIRRFAAILVLTIVMAACGGPATASLASPSVDSGSPAPSLVSPAGSRPSSPAIVSFEEPTPNEAVTGTTVHVVISLKNATIVPATTTAIRSDQGHVHLYVDNVLVSMNYGLTQDLPVHPGTYVIKAEFVAADHAPFDPRVWSDQVAFTVK
jgi:ABC-type glycerol-3-phosphate transport system substrate-binding protein